MKSRILKTRPGSRWCAMSGPDHRRLSRSHRMARLSIADRIMRRVVKMDGPLPTQCWIWTGSLYNSGYGQIGTRDDAGKEGKDSTHRAMWKAVNGEISGGLFVLHKCDTKTCVNPSHLFLGTQRQNMDDAMSKNRMASGDNHGLRRHPECVKRGERQANAKLTESTVREMRLRRAAGESCHVLGKDYGVHYGYVTLVCEKRRWKHVE